MRAVRGLQPCLYTSFTVDVNKSSRPNLRDRDSWATLAGFGPAGLSIEPGMVDEILYGLDSAPREHDSLEARDQPPQGGDLG